MSFRYEQRWVWWYRPIVALKQWRWTRKLGLRPVLTDAQLREHGLPTSADARSLAQYVLDALRRTRP